jgi:ribulose-phosphate 3-epimerase
MLTDVLDKLDTVLVMSVNPGFGGQKFIPRATQKAQELNELREKRGGKFRIAVDGGIELGHTAELARAGVNTFIAGTSIFRTPDPAEAVRKMRSVALAAASPVHVKRTGRAVTPVSTMPSRRSRKGD